MTDKNAGESAFPRGTSSTYTGMTLRDYFAAKALQGLLASDVNAPLEQFASQSYLVADEMLKARET